MRDPNATAKRRDEMAKAATPFLHSKLASIEKRKFRKGLGSRELRSNLLFRHAGSKTYRLGLMSAFESKADIALAPRKCPRVTKSEMSTKRRRAPQHTIVLDALSQRPSHLYQVLLPVVTRNTAEQCVQSLKPLIKV